MDLIKEILDNTESIAVIGVKNAASQPAFRVPYYMYKHGYKIYPVNPKLKGIKLFGSEVFNNVNQIREVIDMVNIFRRPEYITEHAKEILKMNPLPSCVWFQLGIYNDEAAGLLKKEGIKVIQNRCIMVEHVNLNS